MRLRKSTRWGLRPALIVAGAVIALLAFGAVPAMAATLRVPQEFDTIQDAENAADPGDVIEVEGRNQDYDENVGINTDDLKVKGVDGRPEVDGAGDLNVFNIAADDVVLRHLKLRGASANAVACQGDDCGVRDIRARSVGAQCVEIQGNGAKVTKSHFRACGSNAVEVDGDSARIEDNEAELTNSDCFNVNGERLDFIANSAKLCEDGGGLDLDNGDRATVEENAVASVDEEPFDLRGDRLEVRDNYATVTDHDCFGVVGDDLEFARNEAIFCNRGVEVDGENPEVVKNEVDGVDNDDAFDVNCVDNGSGGDACEEGRVAENRALSSGDDSEGIDVFVASGTGSFRVANNLSRDGFGEGYNIDIADGVISGNVATGNGAGGQPGFDINGDRNTIEDNEAIRNGGRGFDVDGGDDNVLRRNLARDNDLDGILLGSSLDDTRVQKNVAEENLGDGIENDGTDTIVRKNTAVNSAGVDCANDGTIAENVGNICKDGSDFMEPSSGIGG